MLTSSLTHKLSGGGEKSSFVSCANDAHSFGVGKYENYRDKADTGIAPASAFCLRSEDSGRRRLLAEWVVESLNGKFSGAPDFRFSVARYDNLPFNNTNIMKTNFVLSGAESYSAPKVSKLGIKIEKGFAVSYGPAGAAGDIFENGFEYDI